MHVLRHIHHEELQVALLVQHVTQEVHVPHLRAGYQLTSLGLTVALAHVCTAQVASYVH